MSGTGSRLGPGRRTGVGNDEDSLALQYLEPAFDRVRESALLSERKLGCK